jgi:hypothetical protein
MKVEGERGKKGDRVRRGERELQREKIGETK